MVRTGEPKRFSATIYKLGINRCVDVSARASNAFGRRGYVPVVGTLNGHPIRATMVPRGGGRHRLFVNGEVRKAVGVDAGDGVTLVLRIDRESREIPVPADVAKALRSRDGGRAAFERLPPGQRREFLRWVLGAKKSETRERRLRKGIEIIVQEAARRSQRERA